MMTDERRKEKEKECEWEKICRIYEWWWIRMKASSVVVGGDDGVGKGKERKCIGKKVVWRWWNYVHTYTWAMGQGVRRG